MCFKVLQGFCGVKHRKNACLPCVEAGGLVAFQHPTTAVSNLPPTADGLTIENQPRRLREMAFQHLEPHLEDLLVARNESEPSSRQLRGPYSAARHVG